MKPVPGSSGNANANGGGRLGLGRSVLPCSGRSLPPSAVASASCSRPSPPCTSSASACSSPSSCRLTTKGSASASRAWPTSLGLRHAFDADHISAIDNTTRKLMSEGKRPLSIGYWFSLGHSTIVVAIGVGIVVAEKAVYGAVSNNNSYLEQFGGIFGTIVSADVPVPDRPAQHRHPRGDRSRVPIDAPRRVRRGRARAPAQQPRPDVPLLRPVDEDDRQGVEDLPGRRRVRPGLRHRYRGGAAGDDRAARLPAPALLLDHVPADPVHRRHDA